MENNNCKTIRRDIASDIAARAIINFENQFKTKIDDRIIELLHSALTGIFAGLYDKADGSYGHTGIEKMVRDQKFQPAERARERV